MQAATMMLFVFFPLLLVALAALMATLLVREAFAAPLTKRRKAAGGISLPLLAGDGLRGWASELAQRVVGAHVANRANRQAAVALAQEVEAEASQVIERSLPSAAVVREPECSDSSPQTILVTVPETLAIVEELQQHASPHELRRVRERARRNLEQMSKALAEAGAATVCPLLTDDHRCAIFAARPLSCRGRCCPNCDPPGEDGAMAEGQTPRLFAVTFGEGISAGLSQGLTNAGLDGRAYELNRALVQALEAPDAADRWLRGEAVFEACH
ncbi:MAG TPA: hypothetical protein VMV10_08295 [Pirellulales bacterium]|nr:hypothetical protein [Pirellulales bacterium]